MRTRFATFALAVAFTRVARAAADDRPLTWKLEVDPPSCDLPRLEREVELACDAMGHGCVVVHEGDVAGEPDRRATLHRPTASAWTLEVHDAKGALQWSLLLDGDERMHRGALWIAGIEREMRAPVVAASEPTVTAPLETATASPAAAVTGSPWGASVAARALVGTGFGPTLGGDVTIAFAPTSNFAASLSLAGERGLSAPAGYEYSALRASAGVAFGAPWGRAPIGVALEAGAVARRSVIWACL